MPIITKPSLAKGDSVFFTLDKNALAALPEVSGDSIVAGPSAWSKVVVEFDSSESNQSKVVNFDPSVTTPEGLFYTSVFARGDFLVRKITIYGPQGYKLEVLRSSPNIDTNEFDVIFTVVLDGILDASFMSNIPTLFSGSVNAVDTDSEGSIYIGGSFSNYSSAGVNNFAKVNVDGTFNSTFNNTAVVGAKFSQAADSCKVLSDDSIMIGGNFTYNASVTTTRSRVVKLSSSGSVDETFCVNAVDGNKFSARATCFAEDSNNNIYVGGQFSNYPSTVGNISQNYLAKFSSTGILDNSFMTNAVAGGKFNGSVDAVGTLSDGSVIVAGAFSSYGTSGRSRLVKLNSDGTLDTAFCANASDDSKFNNTISDMYVYPNGKVLVVGNFTNYNGVTGLNSIARLNADGSPDTAFNNNIVAIGISAPPSLSLVINDVTVNASGTIFIGGSFAGLGTNFKLGSINDDGTPNSDFNSVLGTTSGGGSVLDVKADANGLYVCTSDTNILGRNRFLKII